MKKIAVFFVLFLLVLGTTSFAQSNNDAQRLVGTWFVEGGQENIILNSNGSYSCTWWDDGKYFINSGKIFFSIGHGVDYYFSIDGRVLFLLFGDGNGIWLNKQ